jgi:hypothetical protein
MPESHAIQLEELAARSGLTLSAMVVVLINNHAQATAPKPAPSKAVEPNTPPPCTLKAARKSGRYFTHPGSDGFVHYISDVGVGVVTHVYEDENDSSVLRPDCTNIEHDHTPRMAKLRADAYAALANGTATWVEPDWKEFYYSEAAFEQWLAGSAPQALPALVAV